MTMHPSVASGRSLSTPPRNSAQPTASAAVTSSLSWVPAPALWLIAVCENPPADGIARNTRSGDAGHAVGGELLVVVDRRLVAAAHGAGDRAPSRGST